MAQMRRANAVFAGEEDFRIAQPSSRTETGAVPSASKPSQKTGLCTSLQGGMNSQTAVSFKVPTESSTSEKQRHGETTSNESLAAERWKPGPKEAVVYGFSLFCCSVPVR